jgi:hypothetical protein
MIRGKYYNLEYLEEISEGDKSTPGVLVQLKQLAIEGNWNQLHYVAHKFAPSFDFVGAEQIKNDVNRLEEYSKDVKNIDEIHPLIDIIKKLSDQIIIELKNDFKIDAL